MNEVNPKKGIEKSEQNQRWHQLVEKAETNRAAYLAKFEGRTVSEKYRLAQEHLKAARAETGEQKKQ